MRICCPDFIPEQGSAPFREQSAGNHSDRLCLIDVPIIAIKRKLYDS